MEKKKEEELGEMDFELKYLAEREKPAKKPAKKAAKKAARGKKRRPALTGDDIRLDQSTGDE